MLYFHVSGGCAKELKDVGESLDGIDGQNSDKMEEEFDEYLGVKPKLQPQGMDPKRG